jgi:hypothetical protein
VDQVRRISWLQEFPGAGKPSDEHGFSPVFRRL